jgi:hypothetical protein
LNYRAIANATIWKIYLLYFVRFVKSDYFLLTTNHQVLFLFIWILLDWNYFKYFSTCFLFFRLILKILHLLFNRTWFFCELITILRAFTDLILKYLFYLLFFLGTRLLNYFQVSFLNMRKLALLVLCRLPFYLFYYILTYFSLLII